MAWIEAHQSLRHHPKFLRLARRVGDEHKAIGILLYLWWWALDYAPDGDLRRYSAEDIALSVSWRGHAEELVVTLSECGFLDADGEGYRIHDWRDYAGILMDRRARHAEYMRARRASDVMAPDVARETHAESATPSGSPAARLAAAARKVGGWRSRDDDEAFFAGQLGYFTEEHLANLIRKIETHRASLPDGKKYKDTRVALGKWLKNEATDPKPIDESQLSRKQMFALKALRENTFDASLPDSVEQFSEWKRLVLSGVTEAEVLAWQ